MVNSTTAADPNTVTIIVGNQTLSGWQDVAISRGIERMPSSFDLVLTEKYPDQAGQIVILPGDPIKVMIGSDLVITGYVDLYSADVQPESHTVHISGRSLCQDLVDTSADFPTYQINNCTLDNLAARLCLPLGIPVIANDGDSVPIPQFNVVLTETPYEILERVARWANFLLYDDPTGALVIAALGDTNMASGFEQGMNVQSASVTYRMDQRFTQIVPVYTATGYALNGAPPTANEVPAAQAFDHGFPSRADGMPRYRPLIVVSEQTQVSAQIAAQRAQWEMARRVGRSQAVNITCDSWRDNAGTLWQPNALASVSIPSLKLQNITWLISEVTYRRGEAGTTCDVTLMPPQAFVPEPEFLLPFYNQVAQELPGGGAANYAPAPR